MWKEFKEFAMRGPVIDLAIGVIIGAAFGKIVTDFVNYILMPPIGLLLGRVDFANLFTSLDGQTYPSLAAAQEAGAPVLAWGAFINTIINFLIVALVIFLVVKAINRMKKPVDVEEVPATKQCPYCATDIPSKATRCPACTSEI